MSRIVSKAQVSILTLVLMLIFPFSSYGIDGQRKLKQPVTFPIIITQSGSYVLTGNLVVTDPNLNAITISVNDVTLDLNGHFIQGPNTGTGTGCGVYAYERYSITIKNGRVRGFGDRGIFLYAGSAHQSNQGGGHRIEDIQALNNALYGIAISGGGVIITVLLTVTV